ncbi:3'-5' exonuclease [Capnocytophaga canis]|uniref:3'-5' exonuclease n=1 Tax=Capnocytophaga canis TaxID=1848903 RepID=UPI0037CEDDE2
MSWFIPENKLDNDQLEFVNNMQNTNDNYFVKGFAGCGKSVLLVHSFLKEKHKNPNAKIIIVTYTLALIDMIKSGLPEKYKHTKVVTYHKFGNMTDYWDLVLVDEVQDLPKDVLQNIKSKSKRIIVAGDSNQSIYDDGCQIDDITNVMQPKTFELGIIHRISRNIRKIAQFFCSDKVNFINAQMGKMVNTEPKLIKADAYEEECKWLVLETKEYAQMGYAPAILLPTHMHIYTFFQKLLEIEEKPLLSSDYQDNRKYFYGNINTHLKKNKLNFQYLGNGVGSFEEGQTENMVTVMTYHSAKGLDFKAVFVPFLSRGFEIWRNDLQRAKTLFFVAITRSREQLFLSYNGDKHPFLNEIPQADMHLLEAKNEIKRLEGGVVATDDEDNFDFVF